MLIIIYAGQRETFQRDGFRQYRRRTRNGTKANHIHSSGIYLINCLCLLVRDYLVIWIGLQVVSCVSFPDLLHLFDFPEDVKSRAKAILDASKGSAGYHLFRFVILLE